MDAQVKREIPVWLERQILLRGGAVNSRPRFRVVWGGNRMRANLVTGLLEHPYQKDRWHLEMWKEELQDYEHAYVFANCPHREPAKPWCNSCFVSGGEYIDATLAIIEARIGLILRVEAMQKEALDKNARMQKDALFGREEAKKEEAVERIHDAVKDAAPITVKRSMNTPLYISADQALGTEKFRQVN